ncbi:MAG: tetratricopeptide repeat protein [Ktedonobacteraceae bacterium]
MAIWIKHMLKFYSKFKDFVTLRSRHTINMPTQQQIQPPSRSKESSLKHLRLLLAVITLLFIGVGTTIAIFRGTLFNTVSIIFTASGAAFALCQWLLPISHTQSDHPTPSSSSSSMPPIIIQVPTMQTVPVPQASSPTKKVNYRGIIGLPPPTEPRTIQQREKGVREVYTLLTQPDVTAVTLTGIGGVGKSILAALVFRYAEEQRQMGKGQFTGEPVWLRVDPAVTLSELASNLFEVLDTASSDFGRLAPQTQAAELFRVLNAIDKPRLIILDQFENLLNQQTGYTLQDRPGFSEWIDVINSQRCPCRLVLTSRLWPQGTSSYPPTCMREYQVKGLEIPEGIELLKKLVAGIDATDTELRSAVEYCDGHTLSLTLLASLLLKRKLSLAALLQDPIYTHLWIGKIANNLLDLIYTEQMDEVERALLLAFSVYREPVSLQAAQAIMHFSTDVSPMKLEESLDVLLTQHLLQAIGEGRYQLHTIIASYAQSHFVEGNQQANQQELRSVHARAAEYYCQQAIKSCPLRKQRQRVNDVHDWIEAIWQYFQAEQWHDAFDVIEREHISTDFRRWGENAALLELYLHLLPLEKWHPECSESARIYSYMGLVYHALWQKETALKCIERALQICKEVGDLKEESWVLNHLGLVYGTMSQYGKALKYSKEALRIHQDLGDRRGEGWALNNIGRLYSDLDENEKALEYFELALSAHRDVGNRRGEGWTLANLGSIYYKQKEEDQALKCFEQALSVYKEIGDRWGEGVVLGSLGKVYLDLGHHAEAQIYFKQALVKNKDVGNREEESRMLDFLDSSRSDS